MTGTASLFEQYFREHTAVHFLTSSDFSITFLINSSPLRDGSNAIHLSGTTIHSSGSKHVDANG